MIHVISDKMRNESIKIHFCNFHAMELSKTNFWTTLCYRSKASNKKLQLTTTSNRTLTSGTELAIDRHTQMKISIHGLVLFR